VDRPRGRVLFIEDQIPVRRAGSGFVRSNDIVRMMDRMGFAVTIHPIKRCEVDITAIYAEFPDTVEVMYDNALADLEGFLESRTGYYDFVWIGRTHNLDQIQALLTAWRGEPPGKCRVILDTEAIAALREAARRAVLNVPGPFDVDAAVMAELSNAASCDAVVAVSPLEARKLRDLGFANVRMLGHCRSVALTPRAWRDRAGFLFVGSFHAPDSPNYDSLRWFVDDVLPLVERELGWETRLTIAGFTDASVDLAGLAGHARVTLRGEVANTEPLYDSHRVFIAPTRFGAGIPYKVHEAASYGVPIVATELLQQQLGWADREDLLVADPAHPEDFARCCVELYGSEGLWTRLRDSAARRLSAECDRGDYEMALADILE
jgi:glycosyltransferase involved in cell wall biosynthesis